MWKKIKEGFDVYPKWLWALNIGVMAFALIVIMYV